MSREILESDEVQALEDGPRARHFLSKEPEHQRPVGAAEPKRAVQPTVQRLWQLPRDE
jgi:hypothetical protein